MVSNIHPKKHQELMKEPQGLQLYKDRWEVCISTFPPHPSRFFKQSQTKWFKVKLLTEKKQNPHPPPLAPAHGQA